MKNIFILQNHCWSGSYSLFDSPFQSLKTSEGRFVSMYNSLSIRNLNVPITQWDACLFVCLHLCFYSPWYIFKNLQKKMIIYDSHRIIVLSLFRPGRTEEMVSNSGHIALWSPSLFPSILIKVEKSICLDHLG